MRPPDHLQIIGCDASRLGHGQGHQMIRRRGERLWSNGVELGAGIHHFEERTNACVFMYLDDGVPREEHQRMRDAFESFCLSTPWGALYQVTSPSPLRSAQRMANRLAAVLRFWDALQGPRYAFRFGKKYMLEELVEDIYRDTMEAWCPGGPASIREHLAITVERMSRATREDCIEAVLRVMPVLAKGDPDLKHHEVLGDLGFLRERIQTLPSRRFEDISSAYSFTVFAQLAAWDRELGRH